LLISSVTNAHEGIYTAEVSNGIGSPVTSSGSTLTVHVPATITTEPADMTVSHGTLLNLTVVASGDPATFTYVWRLNGTIIAGSTLSYHTVASATRADDEGQYTVTVSNGVGAAVNSRIAAVEVDIALSISQHPTPEVLFVEGATFNLTAAAGGLPPPDGVQWFKNGVAIAGATQPVFAIVVATAADEANYTARFTNPGGTATSNPSSVVYVPRPTIVAQPSPAEITRSEAQQFSITVSATSRLLLTYQWFFDAAPIAGATSATLTIAAVTHTNEGNYTVAVSNGSPLPTISDRVQLTVLSTDPSLVSLVVSGSPAAIAAFNPATTAYTSPQTRRHGGGGCPPFPAATAAAAAAQDDRSADHPQCDPDDARVAGGEPSCRRWPPGAAASTAVIVDGHCQLAPVAAGGPAQERRNRASAAAGGSAETTRVTPTVFTTTCRRGRPATYLLGRARVAPVARQRAACASAAIIIIIVVIISTRQSVTEMCRHNRHHRRR
jgi:hypothetical protein